MRALRRTSKATRQVGRGGKLFNCLLAFVLAVSLSPSAAFADEALEAAAASAAQEQDAQLDEHADEQPEEQALAFMQDDEATGEPAVSEAPASVETPAASEPPASVEAAASDEPAVGDELASAPTLAEDSAEVAPTTPAEEGKGSSADAASTRKVEKPQAVTGLVANGSEQVGVPEGEGYTLSGTWKATEPGEYLAVAILEEGYAWSDGTTDALGIAWSIAQARADGSSKKLAAGTYTVTANLWMPGKYNPVLSNVDVYANNPNNPFGVYDENDPSTVDATTTPTTPLTSSATLVVDEDGQATLVLPILNPVFTTQALGTCAEIAETWVERVSATGTYPEGYASEDGKYGKFDTRIHKAGFTLTDVPESGSKTYDFYNSYMYAVPLDLDFQITGNPSLYLTIDYDSLKKVSESAENPFPKTADSGKTIAGGTESGTSGDDGDDGGDGSGTADDPAGTTGQDNDPVATGNNAGTTTSGTAASTGNTAASTNTATSQTVNRLQAGTYRVTSNIWISKASSGLPLSPHITSGAFPPKDPVSDNASLSVDSTGRALLTVPIPIQSKVMTVQGVSISGYDIVSSASSDGALTSITVDLGVLENPNAVITRSATVNITMGSLASVISGISGSQTWGATFEVNLSGVPTTSGSSLSGTSSASGGGTLTAQQLALIEGYEGVSSEESAQSAALAALGEGTAAVASEGATASGLAGASAQAKAEAEEAAEALAQGDVLGAVGHGLSSLGASIAANAAPFGAGVAVGAAAVGGTAYGVTRRKKGSE